MTHDRDPSIEDILDALADTGSFGSIEEAEREMAKRVREYNARPQAELGGLSPEQMIQLLNGDWKSFGALHLEEHLTLDDLAGAPMLTDARTLLEYFETEGPVKETAAHYLPRAVVKSLLPRLSTPRDMRISRNERPAPPVNEADVPWLPDLRDALLFGKLLVRRKGLRVTPLGRALRSPDRAGELYAHIFRTFFRVLDLRVLDNSDRHPGLQASIGYSLYKLGSVARRWKSAQDLAVEAWLESAKDPPIGEDMGFEDLRFYTFQHRLLDPLVQFGLLDIRSVPHKRDGWTDSEYRCTPLFSRFLRFEFQRL
jgi:hypothetical protein